MSGFTEWLANLDPVTVLIIVAALLVIRFALLKIRNQAAKSAAETAESLAVALFLVFMVIRPFFIQAFFIPSESMVPTLLERDHILVNKAVYRMRDPKPGEIMVFKAPPEAKADEPDFIKRVVGVPGDVIYVEPGHLEVNGVKYDRMTVRSIFADQASSIADDKYPRITALDRDEGNMLKRELISGNNLRREGENLFYVGNVRVDVVATGARVRFAEDGLFMDGNKVSEAVIASYFGVDKSKVKIHAGYVSRNGVRLNERYIAEDADIDYPDLQDPFVQGQIARGEIQIVTEGGRIGVKIPEGRFLMMGDNRNNSDDSRRWGTLERDRVKGRAMFIFFPFNRIHWLR